MILLFKSKSVQTCAGNCKFKREVIPTAYDTKKKKVQSPLLKCYDIYLCIHIFKEVNNTIDILSRHLCLNYDFKILCYLLSDIVCFYQLSNVLWLRINSIYFINIPKIEMKMVSLVYQCLLAAAIICVCLGLSFPHIYSSGTHYQVGYDIVSKTSV